MLVPIAIGGFVLSLAFDIVCAMKGAAQPWPTLALWTMVGGIVGALLAAIPGLVDLLSLPAGPVKKTALTHMGINLTVVALYIANACLRFRDPQSLSTPFILSLVAIGLLLISGWLGGKMVFEAGVGVNPPADIR
jgi:uncharacterized membrane protein